jgi:hypothetical protein
MNIDELKNLAKKMGGVVIINNNIPEFVILSYENYRKIEGDKNHPIEKTQIGRQGEEAQLIERLNKEILALKEEIKQREEEELEREEELENELKETEGEELEEIR